MSGTTDAGALNRRLVLEAPVDTADDQGGATTIYVTATTLWAALTPVEARTDVSADAAGAAITHRIVVRGNFAVTLRHRLRDGDILYRIVAIRERDDRRFLDIDAERRID
jgi:SPP1 family predicted phage head-tail adaptor